MKRLILIAVVLGLAMTAGFCAEPVVIRNSNFPEVTVGLESVVGKGLWMYTWPHEFLPKEFKDFTVVDFPKEKTMGNWGKAVVLESSNGTRIKIECKEDYSGQKIEQPWAEPQEMIDYSILSFHNLKAGIGQPIHQRSDEDQVTKFIAFRLGKIVFEIKAMGRNAQQDALLLAEEIYTFKKDMLRVTEPKKKIELP